MAAAQRKAEVDALRGFALFGICVVNVPFLAAPFEVSMTPPDWGGDRAAAFVVELLFQGKFFVLFSFLFGWGFAVQMASAERHGIDFGSTYRRRLAGILFIGVAHALLVFTGDILVLYAILGLSLPLIRNRAPKQLIYMAGVLVAISGLALAAVAIALEEIVAGGEAIQSMPEAGYLGGVTDAFRQRLADWPAAFAFIGLFNGPMALACFCAGLAAAKGGFFERDSKVFAAFKRRLPILLGAGLFLNLGYVLAVNGSITNDLLALLAFSGLAIGGPCLATVYLVVVIELARRNCFRKSTLAAGRMSLTAYVAEGVIAGAIFNGYGLGYYGRCGQLACLAIAIGIYVLTHALCGLWLRRFSQGPLEVVLRTITRGFAKQ